jgi:hypothetical protein
MIVQPAATKHGDEATAAAARPPAQGPVSISLEGQVQNALNLWLPLKNRAQMPALIALLNAEKDTVHDALAGLEYVHFARFMPAPDGSILWVITEYDGGLHSYVMDFVAVLGDIFTAILQFVDGAPRLPVNRYPRDFVDFIDKHNLAVDAWSAYPEMTVIDILQARRPA